jgi:hypothetical protein
VKARHFDEHRNILFYWQGNSLFVAEELHKKLPESRLIPIVSLLNLDVIETKAENVGIVFPLQGPTFRTP